MFGFKSLAAAAAAALCSALPGGAVTLNENLAGDTTSSAPFFWGQKVSLDAGGPWNDIAFSFYDQNTDPLAIGALFLVSQEFAGTPDALSDTAPGVLASAQAENDMYSFASNVVLQGGEDYWFYTGSALSLTGGAASGDPDEQYYLAGTGGSGYFSFQDGVNHSLTGSLVEAETDAIAPVPLPAGLVLLVSALGGFGLLRARKAV